MNNFDWESLIIGIFTIILLWFILGNFIAIALWSAIAVNIFGLPTLGFWQMLGLRMLIGLLLPCKRVSSDN